MTQLFADGEQLGGAGVTGASDGARRPMIRQRPAADDQDFGPALTAGKGVRAVECMGCSEPTLPRADDNAPLCPRCTDRLDTPQQGAAGSFAARWFRKR